MFTGIVTAVGVIRDIQSRDGGLDLTIAAPFRRLAKGESIAVNGACLTVATRGWKWFRVHAVVTTLDRTLFGDFEPGQRVNLERALRLSDRLGGHVVQGHVDGIGAVTSTADRDDALLIDLRVPPEVASVTVPKGSIAVDGVSMTVNARPVTDTVQLSVIPFTRRHTTLGSLRSGDRVHVEADVLAKYVEQLIQWRSIQ